jgi:hypothetical protein
MSDYPDFEVGETVMGATDRMFEQYPAAQPWVIRIRHRAVDHFGARSLKKNPFLAGMVSR